MKPADFKRWRKTLGLSQKAAAEALGLKRRVVQYYERGERDGKRVKVPKTVRLACYALALGIEDYKGPSKRRRKDPARRADPGPESGPPCAEGARNGAGGQAGAALSPDQPAAASVSALDAVS